MSYTTETIAEEVFNTGRFEYADEMCSISTQDFHSQETLFGFEDNTYIIYNHTVGRFSSYGPMDQLTK